MVIGTLIAFKSRKVNSVDLKKPDHFLELENGLFLKFIMSEHES